MSSAIVRITTYFTRNDRFRCATYCKGQHCYRRRGSRIARGWRACRWSRSWDLTAKYATNQWVFHYICSNLPQSCLQGSLNAQLSLNAHPATFNNLGGLLERLNGFVKMTDMAEACVLRLGATSAVTDHTSAPDSPVGQTGTGGCFPSVQSA